MKHINNSLNLSKISFKYELNESDIHTIKSILETTDFFYDYEINVAVEIAKEYIEKSISSGYNFVLVNYDNRIIGFSCYGEIPCTKNSYDLYWIALHNDMRSNGIGLLLLNETELQILKLSGRRVYIETSSKKKYISTQKFYLKAGYTLEARLKDFYNDNDDKLIYSKTLISD